MSYTAIHQCAINSGFASSSYVDELFCCLSSLLFKVPALDLREEKTKQKWNSLSVIKLTVVTPKRIKENANEKREGKQKLVYEYVKGSFSPQTTVQILCHSNSKYPPRICGSSSEISKRVITVVYVRLPWLTCISSKTKASQQPPSYHACADSLGSNSSPQPTLV